MQPAAVDESKEHLRAIFDKAVKDYTDDHYPNGISAVGLALDHLHPCHFFLSFLCFLHVD